MPLISSMSVLTWGTEDKKDFDCREWSLEIKRKIFVEAILDRF